MKTLLTHTSALEALRSWNLRQRLASEEVCLVEPPDEPCVALSDEQRSAIGLSDPVEILVSADAMRRRNSSIKTRVAPQAVPAIRISDEVYCVAPEYVALQLAPSLTRLELALLLSELMGVYAVAPSFRKGMFTRDKPLVTPERITALLEQLGHQPGTAKVRDALRMSCVGSASPYESKLSLRLGLKPSLGGYGLEVLSMNDPIEVERVRGQVSRRVRKPDILLKAHDPAKAAFKGVAFEYNGRHHNDDVQRREDDLRSNELLALGLKDYVIDKKSYDDLDYMDWIAAKARKDLGYPPLKLSHAEARRRRERREQLYWELEAIDGIHWGHKPRVPTASANAVACEDREPVFDRVPIEAYEL